MKQFVVIDGPDGVGKTTLAMRVVDCLRGIIQREVIYTCEPTKTPFGAGIRDHLRAGDLSPDALLVLFLKDRATHLKDVIEPAIQRGAIVVCDRYKYSTTCYQHIHGMPLESLLTRNNFPAADVTFLVHLPPGDIAIRMEARGLSRDLFEKEAAIERACEMFKSMPLHYPNETCIYLDGRRCVNDLAADVVAEILK